MQRETAHYVSLNPESTDGLFTFVDPRSGFTQTYKFIKELGRGGIGCVYEVKLVTDSGETNESKTVALKKILQSETHCKYIIEGLELIKNISHKNILPVYDIFYFKTSTQSALYFTMPLYEEGDLKNFVKKNSNLNQKTIVDIFSQILTGLEILHSNSVIHRDLSLDNIMIRKNKETNQYEYIIADFDTTRQIEQTASHTKGIGKYYYIAPEIISGKYGTSADIWSLGVMFIEIMSPTIKNILNMSFSVAISNEQKEKLAHTKIIEHLRSTEKYEEWLITMVVDMIKHDPKQRPTCKSLLKNLNSTHDVDTVEHHRIESPKSHNKQNSSSRFLFANSPTERNLVPTEDAIKVRNTYIKF